MTWEVPQYSCPFINQYVRVPEQILDRVNADHPAESGGVRHCIGLIAVNLLAQGEIAYSRNSNHYTEHRTALYTRTNMLRAVEAAVAQGYAVRSKEGFWDRKFERGLSSTLGPGPRIRELGPPGELELDIRSLPLLVVDGRQVFDQTGLAQIVERPGPASPESRTLLTRLGDIYSEALRLNRGYWNGMEIGRGNLGPGERCLGRVGLTRVFTGGGVGRWFQRGGLSYQQLPKSGRAKLLLDGEEVTELDYPAMHPNLIYARERRQLKGDFYGVIMALCGCTRHVAKMVALMAVNARGYRELVSAVNFGRRWEPEPTLYDELRRLGLTPREVVRALVIAHPVIERYLFSNSANLLMLKESEIVTSALLRLMGLGIPTLPVHDSLVAPTKHRTTVKRLMEDEYRRQTGFEITVS